MAGKVHQKRKSGRKADKKANKKPKLGRHAVEDLGTFPLQGQGT